MSRVTEGQIRAVLAGTYTAEGIDIWWNARNCNLLGLSPRHMLWCGNGDVVLAEAERLAGDAW